MGFLDETGLARFLSNLKSWINSYGNAASATKLASARKLKTSLASSADATFDGSANQESIPVTGVLPVANGGTGSSTKNFVDLLSSQTIGGEKTFTSIVNTQGMIVEKSSTIEGETKSHKINFGMNNDNLNAGIYDFTGGTWVVLSTIDGTRIFYGNANTATKATQDASGNVITSTYATKTEVNAKAENSSVVHNTGDETVAGGKTFSNVITSSYYHAMWKSDNVSAMRIYGGNTSGINGGGRITLYGGEYSTTPGEFTLQAGTGSTYKQLIGKPDGTLTWSGNAIQTASDERLKTPLCPVPDEVLDAWETVGWGQFRFLDAVERKGETARLHLGVIAQRVKAEFEARGLDACVYGILCHDVREATKDSPAVDLWTVRYEEALAMEAAYQRRRADRLEARISALEEKLDG